MEKKRIHFIAIGGAAMHNMALALAKKGYHVTGSDDKIAEPSLSRLKNAGLLPEKEGWFSDKINSDIEAIILGMHARKDNPELLKAQQLKLKIYSYPEFLYQQTKDKKRIAIAGSHGKTTVTSMVMHVTKTCNIPFDFMVGANIQGFDTMVSLDQKSAVAIFEADEYLSSPLDLRPKFIHYKPHIAIINGIAWDHINVFPTYDIYKQQFLKLIDIIEPNGTLIYNETDEEVCKVVNGSFRDDLILIPYGIHNYEQSGHQIKLITEKGEKHQVQVFGEHNMINLSAAKEVCLTIGVDSPQFYEAISNFEGSAKRLQKIFENEQKIIFIDFAHAPSKLKATIDAVRQTYPEYMLNAVFELHTFSSLNKDFLKDYKGSTDQADQTLVYCNPDVIAQKKLAPIQNDEIKNSFGSPEIIVSNNIDQLNQALSNLKSNNKQIFLFMSSGNFDGKADNDLIQMCH